MELWLGSPIAMKHCHHSPHSPLGTRPHALGSLAWGALCTCRPAADSLLFHCSSQKQLRMQADRTVCGRVVHSTLIYKSDTLLINLDVSLILPTNCTLTGPRIPHVTSGNCRLSLMLLMLREAISRWFARSTIQTLTDFQTTWYTADLQSTCWEPPGKGERTSAVNLVWCVPPIPSPWPQPSLYLRFPCFRRARIS